MYYSLLEKEEGFAAVRLLKWVTGNAFDTFITAFFKTGGGQDLIQPGALDERLKETLKEHKVQSLGFHGYTPEPQEWERMDLNAELVRVNTLKVLRRIQTVNGDTKATIVPGGLGKVCSAMRIELVDAHRAVPDATATGRVAIGLAKKVFEVVQASLMALHKKALKKVAKDLGQFTSGTKKDLIGRILKSVSDAPA